MPRLAQPDGRGRRADLALAPAAHAAQPPPGWQPDVAAASAYAAARAGAVSFSVRTEHRVWGRDARRAVPSASVLKAMLLVAYLRQAGVRDRRLVRRRPRAARADDPLVRQRDRHERARTSWGTRVSCGSPAAPGCAASGPRRRCGASRASTPRDQSRYLLHIDRLVPRRHRAYAMRLLGSVVPLAALGDRARASLRLGAVLQGRLGLGQRRGGPPGGAPAPRQPADRRWRS